MEAFFDKTNHPKIKITVCGRKRKETLIALLDTGFDAYLSLPIPIAVGLGLELEGITQAQYADGRISNELVFSVNIIFNGKIRTVTTTLTNSTEALVGTALLAENKVTFNFPKKKIDIN